MKTFSALFTFLGLVLWSLSPMSQHSFDRTWTYWIMWAIMEGVLLFGFVKAWLKLGE